MTAPLFDRVTIIGLGLIGGSIAKAMRKHRLADTIVGCDESDATLTFARSSKVIDIAMSDLATAVRDSKLTILAVPPLAMDSVVSAMADGLQPGAIVMDTASVKAPVMKSIARFLPSHTDFIPAHPIAGSEQHGLSASRVDLFQDKRVIVTPNEPLQDNMLQTITRFWNALGAKVEGMPPDIHDFVYAHVSHLPQLLAFALPAIIPDHSPVSYLISSPRRGEVGRGASKSESLQVSPHPNPPPTGEGISEATLKAFMRLSGSSQALWSDIFWLNREHILAALDRYLDALWHIQGELKQGSEPSPPDETLVREVLFPRIIASCLATTVMEAEKKAGFSFARYVGTGFADFTAPIRAAAPDNDIEQISGHYPAVLDLLQAYAKELQALKEKILDR